RPLVLADVAVPRDVDPRVRDLPGCVVHDIDDLERVAAAGAAMRCAEAQRAEEIVAEEVERFLEWQRTLPAVPVIAALRRRGEEIRAAAVAELHALSPRDRELVEAVTSQIVARLLHEPTLGLKRTPDAADAVRRLFDLAA